MLIINYFSDRTRMRGPFIMGVFSINLIGWAILRGVVHNEHAR